MASAYDAVDRKVKALFESGKVGAIQVSYSPATDRFSALVIHDDFSQPLEGEGESLYFAIKEAIS